MIHKDVREFIDELKKTEDIIQVDHEVNWDLELGAIGRRAYEKKEKAILFNKVKDYPGQSVFSGMLGTFRRVAISLGLPPSSSVKDIYAEYEKRIENPIKPEVVDSAPCKENIISENDVDLYQFPTPYLHDGDGGRYIGTWAFEVTKEPDTGWQNWGMYRFMIHNKRYIVGWPRFSGHLGKVLHEKYVPNNEPMPMALVIGTNPSCLSVSTVSFGIGVDEADYAGALNQGPEQLVKCETSDLLVPANSEIVIECEILPDRVTPEGPFGEYPGFRTEGMRSGVLGRVKAITYRNSPVFTTIPLGIPPDDSSVVASMTAGVAMKRRLLRHGVPVKDVYVPPAGVTHLVVVGVKQGGRKVAEQVRDVFLSGRRVDVNKIIVVDDEDPFNFDEVIHAFSTKCHPVHGGMFSEVDPGKGNALTPCYTAEERRSHKGGLMVFDATWPAEWSRWNEVPVKNSFEMMYPDQIKKSVLENWEKYGFNKE